MDYMLLHNLYYLGFLHWDYRSINISNASQRNVAGIINSTEVISTGTVNYLASGKICMKPGFSAKNGAIFTAKLGNICGDYNANIYKKISYDVCTFTPVNNVTKSARVKITDTAIHVINSAGNLDNLNSENVNLYPNPASDEILVKGLSGFNAEVFDLSGRKLNGISNSGASINISGLNPGIYVVHIKSNGITYIKRIVKQ